MHLLHAQFDGHITINRGHLLAEQHDVTIVQQRFAIRLLLDLCGSIQCLIQRAETLDQLNRAFVSDSRGSGNVVDRISPQGHNIYHALRRYSENLFDFGCITDEVVLGRIQDQHSVVHELQHILVAGNDVNNVASPCGLLCQGSDHIVSFISCVLENRNAVGFQGSSDVWQLLRQIGGHFAAISLVAEILHLPKGLGLQIPATHSSDSFRLLITKCGRSHVKYRSQIFRGKIIAQLAQHIHEDVCRRSRQPGASGHPSLPCHGVIGPKNERHGVHQENAVFSRRYENGLRGGSGHAWRCSYRSAFRISRLRFAFRRQLIKFSSSKRGML